MLLLTGRDAPGLRFVVNATLGISDMPYRVFLLVGSALDDFPLASVVISGVITTAVIVVFFTYQRRQARAG